MSESESSFAIPPDFKGEVRLFPLPDLVMFPNNVLPLHIFESRYREMLEDAVQADGLITMATLLPGYDADYYSRPPVAPMVCIGQIAAHSKTDEGTYNLILVGLQRARIEHEIEPVRAFRRAKVSLLSDHNPEYPKSLGERLSSCVIKMIPQAERVIEEFKQDRISLGLLTDVLAFHSDLTQEKKLQLLAETDPRIRAEALLHTLAPEDQPRSRPRSFPASFSDN